MISAALRLAANRQLTPSPVIGTSRLSPRWTRRSSRSRCARPRVPRAHAQGSTALAPSRSGAPRASTFRRARTPYALFYINAMTEFILVGDVGGIAGLGVEGATARPDHRGGVLLISAFAQRSADHRARAAGSCFHAWIKMHQSHPAGADRAASCRPIYSRPR
jgi:hypothetical protein